MRNITPVRIIFAVNVRGYITDEGAVTRLITITEITDVDKKDFFDIIDTALPEDKKILMEDRHLYTGDKVTITVTPDILSRWCPLPEDDVNGSHNIN